MLCLARLGLRAGEVARLTLDDLDWRASCLRLVAPKGRRERQLPLSAEVGQALAAYLRAAPPSGPSRALFRRGRDDRPLQPSGVSHRAGAAMARAGGASPGKLRVDAAITSYSTCSITPARASPKPCNCASRTCTGGHPARSTSTAKAAKSA